MYTFGLLQRPVHCKIHLEGAFDSSLYLDFWSFKNTATCCKMSLLTNPSVRVVIGLSCWCYQVLNLHYWVISVAFSNTPLGFLLWRVLEFLCFLICFLRQYWFIYPTPLLPQFCPLHYFWRMGGEKKSQQSATFPSQKEGFCPIVLFQNWWNKPLWGVSPLFFHELVVAVFWISKNLNVLSAMKKWGFESMML